MFDDRREILFANSRFLEMTGLTSQDLQDFALFRLYSAQEWEFLMRQGDLAFLTGKIHREHLARLVEKGVLIRTGRGRYKLYHPLFREFLRQTQ